MIEQAAEVRMTQVARQGAATTPALAALNHPSGGDEIAPFLIRLV